jgi:TonB-dependent receptor
MNHKKKFGFVLVILFFVTTHFSFAQQESGTINGKITDASNGDELAFANVIVKGQTIGAITEFDGSYKLEIAPGTYTLLFSYVGYEETEKQVTVKANETVIVNVQMVAGNQLDEIVVSVQVRGQLAAIREQVASNKIANIISAEKMVELPDANAAEAIGRLPGIALERNSGEANKVVIRGLDPAQSNVTIGGVKMASTSVEDRSADLSMIQSEMLAGVEVSKTLRADMDAGATGGTVDVRLATAREKPSFNAMSESGYSNLFSNVGDSKTSVGGSTRFLKSKFGAKIQGTYEQKQLSSQRFRAGYSDRIIEQVLDEDGNLTGEQNFLARTQTAALQQVETIRERIGVSLVLDFKSSFYEMSFLNLVNKTTDDVIDRDENYNFLDNTMPFRFTVSATETESVNRTHLLENKFNFLGTTLNLSLSHTEVKRTGIGQIFPFLELSTTAPFIDQNYLIFRQPLEVLDLYGGTNVSDNKLRSDDRNTSELTDKNYDINLDWDIPFKLEKLNITGVFSVGGKYHVLKRESNQEQIFADYLAGRGLSTRTRYLEVFPNVNWPAGDAQGILATNFVDPNYNPPTINGLYSLNWSPNIGLMKSMQDQLYATHPDLFHSRGQQSYTNDYSNREEQVAAYVMAEINIGKLQLVPGIRMEKVNTDYSAFTILTNPVNTNGITGVPDSISVKRDNKLFFPSINAKYQLGESFALRGAVYKSVIRPGFIQLSPKTVVNPNSNNFSSGNPFLEPATAWNYDILLEVYNSKFGLLTINPFYKRIDNSIVNLGRYFPLRNDRIVSAPDGFVESLPGTDFYPVDNLQDVSQTTIPINNPEKEEYYGVEFSYQTNFRRLKSKVLKGIVLDVNVTLSRSKRVSPVFKDVVIGIDSTGFIPRDIIGYEYRTQEAGASQPGFVTNLILGWDHKGFSARASYRFQDKIGSGLDDVSFADNYTDIFQTLDVSIKQKIAKGLDIYLNATNLTGHIDKRYRVYPTGERFPINEQNYGSRGQLGVRYRF